MLQIKFIGTGSGKTDLNRNYSAILLTTGSHSLLVDAGDGISKALLTQSVSINAVDSILISHLHPDHYSGLASMIVQLKLNKRKRPLTIFVSNSDSKVVEEFLYNSYLFRERMGFDLYIRKFKAEDEVSVSDDFIFIGRQNSHLDEYKEFDSQGKLGFSCLSFMFKTGDQKIQYTGDVGKPEDLHLFRDNPPDLLISEFSHVNLSDVLQAAIDQKVRKVILTHISEEGEIIFKNLPPELGNFDYLQAILAYDGYTITL